MANFFAYVEQKYQTLIVLANDETGTATSTDIYEQDFVTGNITPDPRPLSRDKQLIISPTTDGTTLTVAAIATDTTLTLATNAGMSVGDKVGIELDAPATFGFHFWSVITVVDGGGFDITITDPMPSGAAIGNQAVVTDQLAGSTNFLIGDDFKAEKASGILDKTDQVRLGRFNYQNRFYIARQNMADDIDSYLASGKDVGKFTLSDGDGFSVEFPAATAESDLQGLADFISEFFSNLNGQQDSEMVSIKNAANSQAAMDAIVYNPTIPVPTGTGTYKPFARKAINEIEVYTAADFGGSGGIITVATDTTYILKNTSPLVITDRFVINEDITFNLTGNDRGAVLVYGAAGTFFTTNGASFFRIVSHLTLVGNAGATLFDINRIKNNFNINNVNFVSWGNMGATRRCRILTSEQCAYNNQTLPWVVDDCQFFSFRASALLNTTPSGNPYFRLISTGNRTPTGGMFLLMGAEMQAGESIVDVDPDLPVNAVNSTVTVSSAVVAGANKQVFTTGVVGPVTSIADASLASRSITVFADEGDETTRVTTSVAHGYLVGQSVDITVTTNYNGRFKIITIPTTTTYVISFEFVADDATGTVNGPSITITSAAHGLSEGEVIGIEDTISYDGGYQIYNALAGTFEVSATFVGSESGGWDTGSLNETDPIILVAATAGTKNSSVIASGGVAGNAGVTSVASGSFGAIDVTGFVSYDVTERFKLTTADNGIWTYIGLDDVSLEMGVSITVLKAGGTQDYEFNVAINGTIVGGVAVKEATIQTTARSFVGIFPVSISHNDTVALQISGVGTTDSVTISGLQMSIK